MPPPPAQALLLETVALALMQVRALCRGLLASVCCVMRSLGASMVAAGS